MSRPVKNRSKFYSEAMMQVLRAAAATVARQNEGFMRGNILDEDDLVQIAWYKQGRYNEDTGRLFLNAKRVMWQQLRQVYERDIIKRAIDNQKGDVK